MRRRASLAFGISVCCATLAVSGHAQEATVAAPDIASEDVASEERAELPPGSARTNALITGLAATAGFYGVAFGTSYLWPSSPVAEDLRIPVAGPYLAVAGAGCGSGEGGCGTFVAVVRTVFASISAIGQTGGVLLLAEAAFLPTSTSGTDGASAAELDSARSSGSEASPLRTWYAMPTADANSFGFSLGGAF